MSECSAVQAPTGKKRKKEIHRKEGGRGRRMISADCCDQHTRASEHLQHPGSCCPGKRSERDKVIKGENQTYVGGSLSASLDGTEGRWLTRERKVCADPCRNCCCCCCVASRVARCAISFSFFLSSLTETVTSLLTGRELQVNSRESRGRRTLARTHTT